MLCVISQVDFIIPGFGKDKGYFGNFGFLGYSETQLRKTVIFYGY